MSVLCCADNSPPHPRTAEGGLIFFSYRCLVFQTNVLKGKPEYFGVIHPKTCFSAYSLKPNFDNLNII